MMNASVFFFFLIHKQGCDLCTSATLFGQAQPFLCQVSFSFFSFFFVVVPL